jgi:triphosphoribosyl-dephospho-CoA synthase
MLSPEDIANAVVWACEHEVNAPKPGNVNCFSGGHDMQVQDFLLSAKAIANPMSDASLSVGEKILASVKATRTVVNCNTNLGIVLLFAPLCKAVEQCQHFSELSIQLSKVMSALTVEDAIYCYQAIEMAEAGGLGDVEDQDISTTPSVTLLDAMKMAKNRDTIAKQYTNNYEEIYHFGLSSLTHAINCGETVEWGSAFAYLTMLASVPDTLIGRKQSQEQAEAVSQKAKTLVEKVNNFNMLSNLESDLIAWDNELKQQAINPGTTADMTAAALLLFRFQSQLVR